MRHAPHDYTVGELGAEIDAFLGEAFREVWVLGSVERLRLHSNGHRYFELVEKGPGDRLVGRLDLVIWSRDRWRIDADLRRGQIELTDGIEARCLVQLGFWAPGGRLQASVRAIDPLFSLGALERRRRLVRERLAELGLVARNRSLELPPLPLEVGLVASADSAAYHDVLASLRASGRPFRIHHVDARVQGAAAEGELVRALRRLGGRRDLDCIAVTRGGGARGDLAAFDSFAVAQAVATCPVPVLTGLGHETDMTICDEVAWRSCHTPTRVAEVLVAAVESAAGAVADRSRRVAMAGRRGVERGQLRLSRARARLTPASRRVARAGAALERLSERIGGVARRRLDRDRDRLAGYRRALVLSAPRLIARHEIQLERGMLAIRLSGGRRIAAASARLEALARLTRELGPQRWLERGFAIARDERGRVVRDAGSIEVGQVLVTELARGAVASRVEEVRP